jgi:hypothetical protein
MGLLNERDSIIVNLGYTPKINENYACMNIYEFDI